jgi:hypothetical protein
LPYFLGSSPASAIQNFSRRFMCRTPIGRREPMPRLGKGSLHAFCQRRRSIFQVRWLSFWRRRIGPAAFRLCARL